MGIISPKLLSMTYATRGEGVNVCWGRGDGRQKKKEKEESSQLGFP